MQLIHSNERLKSKWIQYSRTKLPVSVAKISAHDFMT